jgi:hypothetical protein
MLSREVLEAIADSPSSTEVERAEARSALGRMAGNATPQSGQDRVDHEIEQFYAPGKRTAQEVGDLFASFAPTTRGFLNDFFNASLCGPPAPGAVERLTALIARTSSAIVRERAQQALLGTEHYLEHADEIEARINSVPPELR